MKTMKKIMVLLLSILMVIGTTMVTSFAEGGYTVTITGNSDDKGTHTYGAYQIFAGDISDGTLSNIQWGSGITEAGKSALGNAKDYASSITESNAEAKANELGQYLSTAEKTGSDKIEGLAGGYYLIQDEAGSPSGGKPAAKTNFILKLLKDVTVSVKSSVPSVEKVIIEGSQEKKVSDYNIGDKINYNITGTLPENFASYEKYKTFTFTDTPSEGLTLLKSDEDPITVKIGNDDITNLFDISITGNILTVSLKSNVDLKTAKHGTGEGTAFAAGNEIVVSYKAELNNKAVIGGIGNDNTVKLTFANDPNFNGDGTEPSGDTPEDKTVVFTYTIKALKVEPTADAPIDEAAYTALDNAEKADYVKVGDKYQKVQSLTGAGFTLYRNSVSEANKVAEIKTGSTFEFKGVDAGTYVLSETTVPASYNKVDDITITVAATYTDDKPAKIATLTVSPDNIGFTADKISGEITGKIINEKGTELPSTGGMGTTILYIIGGALVVICGIMLVAKKRTGK